jgi:hypothetical protein
MDKDKKIEMWAILGTNFAIVALVIALFTWNRTESNSDRRDMMAALNSMHQEIYTEMKDFHGRLCKIEAEKK